MKGNGQPIERSVVSRNLWVSKRSEKRWNRGWLSSGCWKQYSTNIRQFCIDFSMFTQFSFGINGHGSLLIKELYTVCICMAKLGLQLIYDRYWFSHLLAKALTHIPLTRCLSHYPQPTYFHSLQYLVFYIICSWRLELSLNPANDPLLELVPRVAWQCI